MSTNPSGDRKSESFRELSSKQPKLSNRTRKRSNDLRGHSAVVGQGRCRRAQRACESCKMKKTKCDGEFPCRRCKDGSLICTAGSRRKTESKQLSQGYAEVLENMQYALIHTVQKLYTMVRDNESWELGEPDTNDGGQPVIHDIASKLGCIRPSPYQPCAQPGFVEGFTGLQLQVQLQDTRLETHSNDLRSRKESKATLNSTELDRTDRVRVNDSNLSSLSKESNQTLYAQQQRAVAEANNLGVNTALSSPAPTKVAQSVPTDDNLAYLAQASFYSMYSMPDFFYTDFYNDSSMSNSPPCSPWSAADGFFTEPLILEGRAQELQQGYQTVPWSSFLDGIISEEVIGSSPDALKAMQLSNLNSAEGTIRPEILNCNTVYNVDKSQHYFNGGEPE